jgi:hypothetical protein
MFCESVWKQFLIDVLVLLEMPRFAGPGTFMRLPSYDKNPASLKSLDVCIVGIPLDIGTSNRSGTRCNKRVKMDPQVTYHLSILLSSVTTQKQGMVQGKYEQSRLCCVPTTWQQGQLRLSPWTLVTLETLLSILSICRKVSTLLLIIFEVRLTVVHLLLKEGRDVLKNQYITPI